ncbi:MAG: RNA polymerase sigma factor [Thermoanaerobaculia bacterium]
MGDAGEPTSTLSELMAAYQAGDSMAFESLYAQLSGPVRGYLHALSRDAARADDLLQETFFHVHRARHTYDPSRSAKAWIYAIAHNVFLMWRRGAGRLARHEGPAGEEMPDIPIPAEAEGLGTRDLVRHALARLPGAQREALLLHHVDGLSFREVGEVLGTTALAAKLRAHRGMVELRSLLAGERG